MCVNKHYIVNRIGKSVLVPCGTCPACLQTKAIQRANKIRSNFPDAGSSSPLSALFVTLTYANDYVPYIRPSEIDSADICTVSSHLESYYNNISRSFDGMEYRDVNIYRDKTSRYVRVSSGRSTNYNFRKKSFNNSQILSTVPVSNADYIASIPLLHGVMSKRGQQSDKVGVLYYKDVQDFVKRLRSNLAYKGYDKYFSVYCCSEYGPRTCRPHFHLLIFCPLSDYKLFSSSIVQAWPYDDGNRTRKNIEIARNVASYVSSYVNCSSFVPPLFNNSRCFKPKASASQGFGLSIECYSLGKVFEAYRRGDLSADVWRYKQKSLVVERVLLPQYVLNRYAPKIKGYSRLSVDALQSICRNPYSLISYGYSLNYDDYDYKVNISRIFNACNRFLSAGYTQEDFVDFYSHVWSLRFSQLYKQELTELDCINANYYAYDNIADYFNGIVRSESFDVFGLTTDFVPSTIDPNEFPKARALTLKLEKFYFAYSKDKEVRNIVLSNFMHI